VAALLLHAGAAVHVRDREGCTPLDLARLHIDSQRAAGSFSGQHSPLVANPAIAHARAAARGGFSALADMADSDSYDEEYDDELVTVGGFEGLDPDPEDDGDHAAAAAAAGGFVVGGGAAAGSAAAVPALAMHGSIFDSAGSVSSTAARAAASAAAEGRDLPTLYSWGSSRNYALGHRDGDSRSRPTIVRAFSTPLLPGGAGAPAIKDISTSSYHTLFLTSAGQVLSCGFGRGTRLGECARGSALTLASERWGTHTHTHTLTLTHTLLV
jgi:hypothetical protein